MPSTQGIINKVNAALTKCNVVDRVVSMRVTTITGGDPLLGLGTSSTNVTTVLNPPPMVQVAAKNYPLMVEGTAMSPDAEYLMKVSVTAMSRAQVLNPNVSIVFQNTNGTVEELFIIGYAATFFQGADICFDLILSSKKRSG